VVLLIEAKVILSWCDAILPYPMPHGRLGQGPWLLGQLFFSPVTSVGPFYRSRKESLTALSLVCSTVSTNCWGDFFCPPYLSINIATVWGGFFLRSARPYQCPSLPRSPNQTVFGHQGLLSLASPAKHGDDLFIDLGSKAW